MEAVARAQSVVGKGGQYWLGTGDYRPTGTGALTTDLPWTAIPGKEGIISAEKASDCAGFAICWAWKLVRHRPGFNAGPWATVSDDINCNSALEDGQHKQELFTVVSPGDEVKAGDLILYPTIRIPGPDKAYHTFIGHVGLVSYAPPVNWVWGDWTKLVVIQCHGPNGFIPGVVRTDGSIWAHHDMIWPKQEHRTHIVRPKERP